MNVEWNILLVPSAPPRGLFIRRAVVYLVGFGLLHIWMRGLTGGI